MSKYPRELVVYISITKMKIINSHVILVIISPCHTYHGFDPPCGSHQMPVFLKFSVRPQLLAQLVPDK